MTAENTIATSNFDATAGRMRSYLQRLQARKRQRIATSDLEAMSDHLLRDMGFVRDGYRSAVRHRPTD